MQIYIKEAQILTQTQEENQRLISNLQLELERARNDLEKDLLPCMKELQQKREELSEATKRQVQYEHDISLLKQEKEVSRSS